MSVTTTQKEIVVPRHVRRKAGIKAGEPVEFSASARTITIKPKKVDPDDVLTPHEAKRLRQSLKQARQGKTRPLAQIKHELGL